MARLTPVVALIPEDVLAKLSPMVAQVAEAIDEQITEADRAAMWALGHTAEGYGWGHLLTMVARGEFELVLMSPDGVERLTGGGS